MSAGRLFVYLVGAGLLAACNGEAVLRRFTPPDADRRARGYISLFTRRQVDSAYVPLVADLSTSEAREQLGKIADLLAGQRFDSMKVIGASVSTANGIRHTSLSYQLHSPSGWFLANVATVDSAGTWFVEGITARPLDRSLEEETRFSLAGKSALHYLWLLLTITCAAVSLGTMVFIATRRAMPKRWRWVAASIIGVSPLDLNWATGAVGARSLSVQFGSAAFMRSGPTAPWIITFALPLGALVALSRYRRWRGAHTGADVGSTGAATSPQAHPIDDAMRSRLVTPDWTTFAERFGRPVPAVLRELYADESLVTAGPLILTDPTRADRAGEWAIATFRPVDIAATESAPDGVPTNAFTFATGPSGDPYYLLLETADEDGPVYSLRRSRRETMLVAETLRQFLSWPHRSAMRSEPALDTSRVEPHDTK